MPYPQWPIPTRPMPVGGSAIPPPPAVPHGWIEVGTTVLLRGVTIPGGVHIETQPTAMLRTSINPFLPTALPPRGSWPALDGQIPYTNLSPLQRGSYLTWMQQGFPDQAGIGYALLHAQGILDGVSTPPIPLNRWEKAQARLAALPGEGRLAPYQQRLRLYQAVSPHIQTLGTLLQWRPEDDLPVGRDLLRLAIAHRVVQHAPIPVALVIKALEDPILGGIPRKALAVQQLSLWRDLVDVRVRERFPYGVRLMLAEGSRLTLSEIQDIVPSGLIAHPTTPLPNPEDLNWTVLQRLGQDARSDLAAYTRRPFWGWLPPDLLVRRANPTQDVLLRQSPWAPTELGKHVLGIDHLDARTEHQLKTALSAIGLGMEPDPQRGRLRGSIRIFATNGDPEGFWPVWPATPLHRVLMVLGALIPPERAESDLDTLPTRLGLPAALSARWMCLLRNPTPPTAVLRRWLEPLEGMEAALWCVAWIGQDARWIAPLERVAAMLGQDLVLLHRKIHAGPEPKAAQSLDMDRVRAIARDTIATATMVAGMLDEPDNEALPPPVPSNQTLLPPRIRDFLDACLAAPPSDRGGWEELAKHYHLKLGPTIETINDWSDATYGALLIEDGIPPTLDRAILGLS